MPKPVRFLDLTVDKDSIECALLCDEQSSKAYVEGDGTAYRIWHFDGNINHPPLFEEYVGAIAEWDGMSTFPRVSLFRSEELFGAAFASIDIIATEVPV